jgi:hypothetical protein
MLKSDPRVIPQARIGDYVVEDHADNALATFKTQREVIDWAKNSVSSHD